MSQNFDDYPRFQQTPGTPILLQHSVYRCSLMEKVPFEIRIEKKKTWKLLEIR
jgi:hypothetical protein